MGARTLDTHHVYLCLWKLSSLAVMAENMPACLVACDTVFWVGIFWHVHSQKSSGPLGPWEWKQHVLWGDRNHLSKMQLHIPEYWNPELHCHKNFNSSKITFIAGYKIQADVRWYVAFGYTKDSAIWPRKSGGDRPQLGWRSYCSHRSNSETPAGWLS